MFILCTFRFVMFFVCCAPVLNLASRIKYLSMIWVSHLTLYHKKAGLFGGFFMSVATQKCFSCSVSVCYWYPIFQLVQVSLSSVLYFFIHRFCSCEGIPAYWKVCGHTQSLNSLCELCICKESWMARVCNLSSHQEDSYLLI